MFLTKRTKIHLVLAPNRESLFLDNCYSVRDFLFLFLSRSPNLGQVTPKVKSVRKLSEDDVVTQKAQYKIQYKYSFSTILEYTVHMDNNYRHDSMTHFAVRGEGGL